jgi:hypothetical protein
VARPRHRDDGMVIQRIRITIGWSGRPRTLDIDLFPGSQSAVAREYFPSGEERAVERMSIETLLEQVAVLRAKPSSPSSPTSPAS